MIMMMLMPTSVKLAVDAGVVVVVVVGWAPCSEGNQRRLGIPPVTSDKIPQLGRADTSRKRVQTMIRQDPLVYVCIPVMLPSRNKTSRFHVCIRNNSISDISHL